MKLTSINLNNNMYEMKNLYGAVFFYNHSLINFIGTNLKLP